MFGTSVHSSDKLNYSIIFVLTQFLIQIGSSEEVVINENLLPVLVMPCWRRNLIQFPSEKMEFVPVGPNLRKITRSRNVRAAGVCLCKRRRGNKIGRKIRASKALAQLDWFLTDEYNFSCATGRCGQRKNHTSAPAGRAGEKGIAGRSACRRPARARDCRAVHRSSTPCGDG